MKSISALFILAGMFLSACGTSSSPRLSVAFENLGGEIATREGDNQIKYRNSYSVSGITVPQPVGSLATVPGDKIPDIYATPIDLQCSRIIEQEFPSVDAKIADVIAVRDQLQAVISLAVLEAHLSLRLGLVNHALKVLERNPAADDPALVAAMKAVEAAVGLVSPDKSALEAARAKLAGEKDQIVAQLRKAESQAIDGARKKNLIVTRWQATDESGGNFSFGKIFGAADSHKSAASGLLVLAHLRTATLVLGDDFLIHRTLQQNNQLTGIDTLFDDAYLVTHSLAAKHRAYTEQIDLEKVLTIGLKLEAAQIGKILSGDILELIEAQTVDLQRRLSSIIRAANQGVVDQPVLRVYHYRFFGDEARSAAAMAEMKRLSGYSEVYRVRSNVATLRALAEKRSARVHGVGQFWCMHSVPNDGGKFCRPAGWNGCDAKIKELNEMKTWKWEADTHECISFDSDLLAGSSGQSPKPAAESCEGLEATGPAAPQPPAGTVPKQKTGMKPSWESTKPEQ